jgi:hypothetical protein
MAKAKTVLVCLPFFPGFYESSLSSMLDHVEEMQADNDAEREASREYYPEDFQPVQLRLDVSEHAEVLMDAMNYRAAYLAIAKDWVSSLDDWAMENLGTAADTFKFDVMDSPREYNFSTDRVYASVRLSVMRKLWRGVDRADRARLIEERHSSRSGFCSWYSSDIAEWERKPFADYDHNEMGTVLLAACLNVSTAEEIRDAVEEPLFEGDYEYVDQHCDWKRRDMLIAERRTAKLADWLRDAPAAAMRYCEGDGEAAGLLPDALGELTASEREAAGAANIAYLESHYRCPFTPDMFEGMHLQ